MRLALFLLFSNTLFANDYILQEEQKYNDVTVKVYSKKESGASAIAENRAKLEICFSSDCSISREGYRAGHLGVAYPFSMASISEVKEFKGKIFIVLKSSYSHGSTEVVSQVYLLENKKLELVFERVSLSVSPAGKEYKTEIKIVNENEITTSSKHKGNKKFIFNDKNRRFLEKP